jgi:hypothetical protein
MTTFNKEGVSIEGGKSDILIRKITDPVLIKIEGVGRFFKYKSKIRAIVKITEELVPKVHRICCYSNLNLDDELDAPTIEILTEKRITLELISNFSNVHGIQGNRVNAFTYAKIVIPWRYAINKAIGGHDVPEINN